MSSANETFDDVADLRDGELSVEQQLGLSAEEVMFCKAVVLDGMSQYEAFIKIRPPAPGRKEATVRTGSQKYASVPRRRRYMAYLQIKAREAVPLSALTLVKELEDARLLAIRVEDPKAMVAATLGKAKIIGMGDLLGGVEGGGYVYEYTRAEAPTGEPAGE